jgi:hypothetical protein
MNSLRKICNAPSVDLVPAVAENQLLEKRFRSRLQQVRDERTEKPEALKKTVEENPGSLRQWATR